MVRRLCRQYRAPMLALNICKMLRFMVNSPFFIFFHLHDSEIADVEVAAWLTMTA